MSRRRWHSRRASPDMGWIVGKSTVTLSYNSSQEQTLAAVDLFDFADIDPEATTGRIEADKSDWFIKRVILNVFGVANLDGVGIEDTARVYNWGLSVAGTSESDEIISNDYAIFGPEWYNLQARILRTGMAPAYHVPALPLAIANPSNNYALGVTEMGPIEADGGGTPVGFVSAFGFWGQSRFVEDFPVSNAGLRNNQTCRFTVCTDDFQGIMNWANGDILGVHLGYQVLMQKRRA